MSFDDMALDAFSEWAVECQVWEPAGLWNELYEDLVERCCMSLLCGGVDLLVCGTHTPHARSHLGAAPDSEQTSFMA